MLYEDAKNGIGGCFTRVILGELKVINIKHGTAEMQWEGAFKEFICLLTETHKQYKKTPPELEKELKEAIKKGKEKLKELQRQDRFV